MFHFTVFSRRGMYNEDVDISVVLKRHTTKNFVSIGKTLVETQFLIFLIQTTNTNIVR